jgi:DNA polymerase-3 subunit gamma/tau
MAYLALYRAWRPQTFADVVGQEHVRRTLQNALSEGRLAHAYLFSGPRGTGKTSLAKILAKAVNCQHGPAPEPCNECEICRQITEGRLLDVMEIDAASHRGVEEIRELREKVKYAPTAVRFKVYIIDEVHMLTTEAFNALLKTLEEPPAHVLFILATTEPHKIPVTILSRCQRFDFARLPAHQIAERLRQIVQAHQVQADPEALAAIAYLADGGMRDALSLLDQVISFADGRVTEEEVLFITGGIPRHEIHRFWQALMAEDPSTLFELSRKWIEQGKEPGKVLEWLFEHGRLLMLAKVAPGLDEIRERLGSDPHLRRLAEELPVDVLIAQLEILRSAVQELKWVEQPRIFLELTMLKLWRASAAMEKPAAQPSAASQSVSAPDRLLHELMQEVQRLRERVQALEAERKREGFTPATDPPPQGSRSADVPAREHVPAKEQERQRAMPEKTPKPGTPQRAVFQLLRNATAEATQRVQAAWDTVLKQVRQKRIFVHAWLVDGEVAAASSEAILLVFKTPIHRETTEKPANRQVIESVLRDVLGQPSTFLTLMQEEWEKLQAEFQENLAQEESSAATAETAEEAEEDEVIRKALEWFGDLVEVKRQK